MDEQRERIVTPRASPDLDGLACAVAYTELLRAGGTRARGWIAGTPDGEAAYVAERLSVEVDATVPSANSYLILVDASDLRGLPTPLDPERVIEVIDHRLHHRAAELFPRAAIQIEPVGAAATLIYERFHALGRAPGVTSAMLLQAAIASNTQALRGSVTTDRDRRAFRELHSLAALPADFVTQQFLARKHAIVADLGEAIRRERKDFEHPDGAYTLSQLELPGARHMIEACVPSVRELGLRAMLNLVDVEVAASYLVVPHPGCRDWVETRAGLRFRGNVAECPGVLLRKQIVARLEGNP